MDQDASGSREAGRSQRMWNLSGPDVCQILEAAGLCLSCSDPSVALTTSALLMR